MYYGQRTPDINVDVPIGALKTQLSRLLMSVDRVGWNSGMSSGRFDVRRTSRMMSGSERVFKSRWETEAVSTAVSIIVDLSSSMAGKRLEQASRTAYALADAIGRVGCEVQVVGFTSGYGNMRLAAKYMRNMAGDYGKSGGMAQYNEGTAQVMKGFGHKLRDRKIVFEKMQRICYGSTPDYHVVRTIVQQLSLMPTHRKMVIVITDGYGETGLMRELTEHSEKLFGVTVLGIGIQTEQSMMDYVYKYNTCIADVADLANGALRAVIDKIEGKRKLAPLVAAESDNEQSA